MDDKTYRQGMSLLMPNGKKAYVRAKLVGDELKVTVSADDATVEYVGELVTDGRIIVATKVKPEEAEPEPKA